MSNFEIGFAAEFGKGVIRVHAQITRIRTHKTGNESGRFKRRHIGIFNRSNVGGFDLQVALHIQQGFAHCGTFAAHQVTQTQVEIVKAFWLVHLDCGGSKPPPDHSIRPMCPLVPVKPPSRATRFLSYWRFFIMLQAILHAHKGLTQKSRHDSAHTGATGCPSLLPGGQSVPHHAPERA